MNATADRAGRDSVEPCVCRSSGWTDSRPSNDTDANADSYLFGAHRPL